MAVTICAYGSPSADTNGGATGAEITATEDAEDSFCIPKCLSILVRPEVNFRFIEDRTPKSLILLRLRLRLLNADDALASVVIVVVVEEDLRFQDVRGGA